MPVVVCELGTDFKLTGKTGLFRCIAPGPYVEGKQFECIVSVPVFWIVAERPSGKNTVVIYRLSR